MMMMNDKSDCGIHPQSRVMDPPSASQLQNAKPVSKTLAIRTSGQQKSEWANKNLIYDHDLIWFKEGWRCLGLGVWHCSSLGYEWEE